MKVRKYLIISSAFGKCILEKSILYNKLCKPPVDRLEGSLQTADRINRRDDPPTKTLKALPALSPGRSNRISRNNRSWKYP
jgi:hypothetical protein